MNEKIVQSNKTNVKYNIFTRIAIITFCFKMGLSKCICKFLQ